MDYDVLPRGNYGWSYMDPKVFATKIEETSEVIADMYSKNEFDAVAFMGSSGAALAFHLAAKYKIPLIYVRKSGEKSHGHAIESNSKKAVKRYLIVDDFVDSGKTIRTIVKKINKWCADYEILPPSPTGVFCYTCGYTSEVKINKSLTLHVRSL